MRRLALFSLLAALAFAVGVSTGTFAEDSPTDPIPDDATVAKLDMGAYWFGKQITKTDLAGKVVLLEIWGS